MGLKSYKTRIRKERRKPVKDLVTGGITALIGTALVVETADVLNRV